MVRWATPAIRGVMTLATVRLPARRGDLVVRKAPLGSARLLLLGGFELRCQGVATPVTESAQRLLALLALETRPAPRSQLAGILWPEATEERAAGSLRSALWRLPHPDLVARTSPGDLSLGAEVTVDYREATSLATALLEGVALDLGHGGALARDLLPGWWDDWLVLERERFRQLRLHALEAHCRWLAETGRFAQAIEAGLLAVACEPLRESAHRLLISIHLAEGNQAEALQQYRRYRRLLADELGLTPSPQLEAVVACLRAR
jgi:DNA-binding SARP family transcriptional activator